MNDDILKFENEKDTFYSKMLTEKDKIEIQNLELTRREEKLNSGMKNLKTSTGKYFLI